MKGITYSTNKILGIAIIRAGIDISNMPIGLTPYSIAIPAPIQFVLDPIKVVIPPSILI